MKAADLEPGFDEWFRRVLPDAVAVARRILGSQAEAEDAAAEGLARALARWSRVRPLDHKDAWLLRTVGNIAIDVVRRRRDVPASRAMETDVADTAAVRVALAAALQRLPRRQRQVVVLRHLAEWAPERVAEALGLSTNTVKKHNERGLTALRAAMGSTRENFDAL